MKLFKRVQSIVLVLAVMLVSVPLTGIFSFADGESTDKTYAVWEMAPAGGEGLYDRIFQYDRGVGDNVCEVLSDEDGAYDHIGVQENAQWGPRGILLQTTTKWTSISNYTGWILVNDIFNKLLPYMTVTFDYRYVKPDPNHSVVKNPEAENPESLSESEWGAPNVEMGIRKEGRDEKIKLAEVQNADLKAGEWVTVTRSDLTSADGALAGDNGNLGFYIKLSEGRLYMDIRNFRIELKESDRAEINKILTEGRTVDGKEYKECGNEWFWWYEWDKDASGNWDYFKKITKADEICVLSPNNKTSKINLNQTEHGKVKGLPAKAKNTAEINFTVEPDEGYRADGAVITDEDGKRISFKRTSENNYSFVMPNSEVTLTFKFKQKTLSDGASKGDNYTYVLWEARPDPSKEAAVADRTEPKNKVEVKNDSKGFYYEVTLTDNVGGLGWSQHGAVIKSNVGASLNQSVLGWLTSKDYLNAILPYVTFKAEIKRGDSTGKNPNINLGFYTWDSMNRDKPLKKLTESAYNGEWQEYEFEYDGLPNNLDVNNDGLFSLYAYSDNDADKPTETEPVVLGIRNFRMQIKEEYRGEFNKLFNSTFNFENIDSNNGWWNWKHQFEGDSVIKDADGDVDFFAYMARFDAESEYSPNNSPHSIEVLPAENGTVLPDKFSNIQNKTVTLTANSADGFAVKSITVLDSAGKRVGVRRTGEKTYEFIMPDDNVTVKAEFAADTQEKGKEYVVWDSDPDIKSKGESALVNSNGETVKNWLNNPEKGFKGSAAVWQADEGSGETSRYEVKLIGKGEGGMVGIYSGHTGVTDIGWLSDRELLKVIMPYLTFKLEARRTDGNTDINPDITVGMASVWGDYTDASFGRLTGVNSDWQSYSFSMFDPQDAAYITEKGDHWSDGYFKIGVIDADGNNTPTEDKPVTLDIRNVYITINEQDMLEINRYLADIEYTPNNASWVWNDTVNTAKENTDSEGNADIFGAMAKYDENSPFSPNYENHAIVNGGAQNGTIKIAKNKAKPNAKISFTVIPDAGYRISRLVVTGADGTSFSVTGIKNQSGTFKMPDTAVTVTAVFVKIDNKLKLLYQADPIGSNGSASITGGSITKAAVEESRNAWKIVYGDKPENGYGNIRFTSGSVNLFADGTIPDGAEMTFKAKTTGGSKELVIVSGDKEKTVTLNSSLKSFVIPVKDLYGSIPAEIEMYVKDAAKGDEIYICGIDIWSEPTAGRTTEQLYEQIWDISDYEMKSENRQVAILGDPDGDVSPWASANGDVPGWSLAWFEEFKGEAPWYVTFKENKTGEIYSLDFYNAWDHTKEQPDISEWVETGYMEFWVKSETDNLVIPMDVCNSDGTRAVFRVVYKKSKARSDGYMRVRIPLIYMASMGLDLAHIRWLHIRSIEPVKDDIYLSAFRFYSNLAPDKPDPVKPVETTPEYNFSIDASMYSVKVDYGKKTITVSDGDQIWQLLSALRFETFGTTAAIYRADGTRVDNENEYFEDGMTLEIVFGGYTYDEFKILINPATKINNTVDNTYSGNNNGNVIYTPADGTADGDNTETKLVVTKKKRIKKKNADTNAESGFPTVWVIAAAAVAVAAAAGVTVFFVLRKKRRQNKG